MGRIMGIMIGVVYCISLLIFGVGLLSDNAPYNKAIDPTDELYSPFAEQHLLTLIVHFILFNGSILLIWINGIKLPPLTLVLALLFLVTGLCFNTAILLQVTEHDIAGLKPYGSTDDDICFGLAPLISSLIAVALIIKVINQKGEEAMQKVYSNKYLQAINQLLSKRKHQPFWVLLLLLPIFLVSTLILTLFGQDIDSVVKVFTETTTWRFSKHLHPPPLDRTGHYLCTVAACGDPEIVKPLRFGQRGGRKIIVNRQLLIANAFEGLLEEHLPVLHKFIRRNYDRHGFNLSKKITTPTLSNCTYILMKPLEWLFLLCLYLCCLKPEEKIKQQYAMP